MIIVSLYGTLLERFGYNEPIFSDEISFESYSKPWIYKELNKLCAEGAIVRFDKGIYYIPTQTVLGKSILNPRKVIEKKYIRSNEITYGYYGGQVLLNQLGLSTQMPNMLEIYTNKESSRVRDIDIGNQKIRLRRSRVNINDDNAAVLCFLELMNDISVADLDDTDVSIITEYIASKKIKREDITRYAPDYPDKVMRNLIVSEVIYSVTQ